MKQDEMRRKLIDGTILVIARDGLDKASTKQIGVATQANEAYIYRCFEDKEDMFAQAFESLDQELFDETMRHIHIMYERDVKFELRCRAYFDLLWAFLLRNRDKCLAFIRYYYSPYFQKYSAQRHKQRFAPLVEKFKAAYQEDADVWMILNHILNVMLDFAIKVHNDQMPNDDDHSEHVFRVIYRSIEQYFKKI